MSKWRSERDFVANFVLPMFKEAAKMLGVANDVSFHVDARVDGGIADLYAEKSGRRLFVLEAKFKKQAGRIERDIEPRDPEVVKQAVDYAANGGFPYYLTCNTRRVILFQLQPGKKPFESEVLSYEFDKNENWAVEILKVTLGQVPVKLKPLDDTLVETLHEAFEDLYPEFLSSLKQKLTNREFRRRYERWLESQGLKYSDEINRLVAEQSAYLQLNKLLFYQVIRTIYPDRLDPLEVSEEEDVQEALQRFYEQARRIDYAPVYESDVISEVLLTDRAKKRFRTLMDTLKEFDFSSMGSDFLGRVYEKLIPPAERKRLGQFYTPPDVAELIVSLTIKGEDDVILDPGCGSGTFLVKAYRRLAELKGFACVSGALDEVAHREIISQLYGIDINQFPAHLSVINLAIQNPAAHVDRINVIVGDFFDIRAGHETLSGFKSITTEGGKTVIKLPKAFDVVVANPPYIRQELLGDDEKEKIKELVETEYYKKVFVGCVGDASSVKDPVILDRQSDIYVYFFIHGLALLRKGGRLGFITSNKWLEAGYGEAFQKFLLRNSRILYIIEFDKAVFPDAEVNTAVTVLEKETDEEVRRENFVKFVRLKHKMDVNEIVRIVEGIKQTFEDERIKVNLVKQSSLEPGKWNVYLRAPPVYQKIIIHPKMKPLNKIAKVFRGLTTGYNNFFILNEEKLSKWRIEEEFLAPCVSSPKKLKGLIIKPDDIKEYFFMVRKGQEVPKDSNAYKYIKYGEGLEVEVTRGSRRGRKKLPELETIRSRTHWYSLPSHPLPSILFPYMIDVRGRAYLNKAETHAVDVMHYIVLNDQTNAEILCAYLNSSIFAFMSELYGRSYGGGVLKVQVYELEKIPVINPELLSSEERKTLTTSFNRLEESIRERIRLEEEYKRLSLRSRFSRSLPDHKLEQRLAYVKRRELEAQKKLDEAVYDILDLNEKERLQVEEGLRELQELRRKRTKPS
jgi:type I restriction-modification system DNA methylase subunit